VHFNTFPQDGATALHLACKSLMCGAETQAGIVHELLQAGADGTTLDKVRVWVLYTSFELVMHQFKNS
jgi:Ankyrin repeat